MFALCRRCAEEQTSDECGHGESERAFTGVYVLQELRVAMERGYKVVEWYELWAFPTSSNTLFRDFMNKALTIKVLLPHLTPTPPLPIIC